MSKKEKLLQKFLETPPRSDLTYTELESLLISFGFRKKEGSGSAVKFLHPKRPSIYLHKPHPSNILKRYIIKDIQSKITSFL